MNVNVSLSDQATLSAKEILDGTLADLGITIADPSAQRQYEMVADLNAFYNSYRIFKDIGVENADSQWITEMMEKYALPAVPHAELLSLLAEPVVQKEAQVATDTYYAIFKAQFAGEGLDIQSITIKFEGLQATESVYIDRIGVIK